MMMKITFAIRKKSKISSKFFQQQVFNMVRKVMKCAKVKKRLSAFLDGELDAAMREAVATHLDTCSRCKVEAKRLQSAYDLLGNGIQLPPDPFFIMRLRARLTACKGADMPITWQRWAWRVILPATVAVGLLIGVLLGKEIQQNWVYSQPNTYDYLSSSLFYESPQASLTADYLALNGWQEVQDEE